MPVIGEGGYGCVIEPSLPCDDNLPKDFNYDGYVSKLLTKQSAIEELKEYVLVANADKNNEFTLPTPQICKPDLSGPNVKEDVKGCTASIFKFDTIEKNKEKIVT